MSLDEQTRVGSLREVAALLGVPDAAAVAALNLESLRRRSHRELLDVARRLGISGLSRLTKDALATKLWESLSKSAKAEKKPEAAATKGSASTPVEDTSLDTPLTHKFELGEHGASTEEPRTIPWSYTMDRVTA